MSTSKASLIDVFWAVLYIAFLFGSFLYFLSLGAKHVSPVLVDGSAPRLVGTLVELGVAFLAFVLATGLSLILFSLIGRLFMNAKTYDQWILHFTREHSDNRNRRIWAFVRFFLTLVPLRR